MILIINGYIKGSMAEISEYGLFRLVNYVVRSYNGSNYILTDGLNDFYDSACKKLELSQEADLLERCKKYVKK